KRASIKIPERICFSVFLTILFLLCTLGNPTGAQADTDLKDAWQKIVSAPTTSVDTLQPVINQFIHKQHLSNIENASIYSLALLKIASRDNLQPSVKKLLTMAAITISPGYSFPETAYSRLMFQQHSYLKSLASLFRAIRKFQGNPLEHLYASTFFWLALAFTPLILLFLSALCLSIKYYRAFCEMGDLKLSHEERLITVAAAVAIAIVIIVLPAPLLGLLLLSLVLAVLATRRDIITLTLLVISLLVVPLAYEKGMASLLALDSSFFKAARFSSFGIDDQDNEAYLRQPAINKSQLTLQLFSQAESARQRREYDQAEIFLEKIISNRTKIGAVYNNLANIYILQGHYKKSAPLYLKAAEIEKNSGIPYYNLSRTYIQQDFDLKKSSQALEMAFKRDPGLSTTQISNNSESELQTGTRLLFMSLPDNFYRHYAEAQPNKDVYLPELLKQALFYGANKALYFMLVILSV
ncbi:MAG: tetratricopeptide repeat protein, partial [Deltaproteobacteria bacterium]|nr:tetratricopeptide repeat protein [Deltaproteobacteria bacterium]